MNRTQYGSLAYAAPNGWYDATVVALGMPKAEAGLGNEFSITVVKHPRSEIGLDPESFLYAQLDERTQTWTAPPSLTPHAIMVHSLNQSVPTLQSTFASPVGEIWQLQAAIQCGSHDYVFTATGLSSGDIEKWRKKLHTMVASVQAQGKGD